MTAGHARLDHDAVLLTRTGLDWTHKYPPMRIDAGGDQAAGKGRAQQQVIDPDRRVIARLFVGPRIAVGSTPNTSLPASNATFPSTSWSNAAANSACGG